VAAVTSVAGVGTVLAQIEGRAEYVLGEQVTAGYAGVFSLHTQAGRWFTPDDAASPATPVAVISDRLWRQWFKADPDIVGGAFITIKTPHRVIGVAPAGFRGIATGLAPSEVWRPVYRQVPPNRPVTAELLAAVAQQRNALTFVRARAGRSMAQITGDVRAFLTGQPDPDAVADTLALQRGQEALRVREFVMLATGILTFSSLVFFAACAPRRGRHHRLRCCVDRSRAGRGCDGGVHGRVPDVPAGGESRHLARSRP
jgi:hypothetical protein